MNKRKQILEQYLKTKFSDNTTLSIAQLSKLRDGWESDNYIFTVESSPQITQTTWVWRIYTGVGSPEKARREFTSMKKLLAAGYPVPQVLYLETEHSPINRPFIIMEYIPSEMMWHLLDTASAEVQEQLIDQFCKLFVQLHALDWKQFDDALQVDDPFTLIDRWLHNARRILQNFSQVDASPFLDWVADRRTLFTCTRPSPVHQDFHPGNVLIKTDNSALVIDWTAFDVSDPRMDLAWTLVLTHAHGRPGLRDQIYNGYQRHAGEMVEQIAAFEAIACARRLLDLTVSLTQDAQQLGMNAQAAEAMHASMEAHRRVHRLFIEHTGLQIKAFDNLFGSVK